MLFLNNSPVTDEGLKELAGLKSPKVLGVRGTKVTDKGLDELKKTLSVLKIFR